MKKLLKGILTLFVLALIILLVLAYFEKEHGLDFPASGMLAQIKSGWEDITKSADEFLTKSGIKQDTADLLEKGAEILKATPGPDETNAPEETLDPENTPTPEDTPEPSPQGEQAN